MSDINQLIGKINKEFGAVISVGVAGIDAERLPTGYLSLDIAMGGGFPVGRTSIVYGPEGSLKTTIALKTIGNAQKAHKEKKCAFVDIEGHYDPLWATQLGVNNDELVYVSPDYAEQSVDIVEALLYAKDIDIIVIDSLAALITANEIDSSADKAVVGGSGLVVGKLYRKSSLALNKARKEGRHPTLIAINQIRHKIGVMFGSNETMPGGNAFKFASSMTIRVSGKDVMDSKVNATLPCYREINGTIKKHKVPVTAKAFKFNMAKIPIHSKGIEVGGSNDWGILFQRLKDSILLTPIAKGINKWSLEGNEFKTLGDVREALLQNWDYYMSLRQKVITLAIQEATGG